MNRRSIANVLDRLWRGFCRFWAFNLCAIAITAVYVLANHDFIDEEVYKKVSQGVFWGALSGLFAQLCCEWRAPAHTPRPFVPCRGHALEDAAVVLSRRTRLTHSSWRRSRCAADLRRRDGALWYNTQHGEEREGEFRPGRDVSAGERGVDP